MCESFFGYDKALRDTLFRMGAKDVYLHDIAWIQASLRGKPNWKTFFSILKNPYARSQWTQKLIEEIGDRHFDIFLCLPITPFKKSFMIWLRQCNPNIRCVLFLWDCVDGIMSYYKDYFHLFDKIWTFDRDDSEKYGFTYQPDFYVNDDTISYGQCFYDMNFIGNLSHCKAVFDRPNILSYIQHFSEKYRLRSFLYLKYSDHESKLHHYLGISKKYEKIINPFSHEDFMHTEILSLKEVNDKQKDARVIIDLTHENRQGLTINAITALAKGKKLLTTNKRIVQESFYNPANIFVLNSKDPWIDINFFKSYPQPVNMSGLRIDNWLRTVLNSI